MQRPNGIAIAPEFQQTRNDPEGQNLAFGCYDRDPMPIDPRAPVLVGAGQILQRNPSLPPADAAGAAKAGALVGF